MKNDKKTPCLVEYIHEPKSETGDELRSLLQEYPTETTKKPSALKDPVVVLGTDRDMKSKATIEPTTNAATGKFFLHTSLPKILVPQLISLFENLSSKNSTTPVYHRKPDVLSKSKATIKLSTFHIRNSFSLVDCDED
ncbi:hypothetical protein MFLAVUS_008937 [Mucor flavus]|uniref:Uncharacterized protein n=1 Tax=Mucor flavus TaxID=439312 RepID=A0ABP9Z8N8_9FUNG